MARASKIIAVLILMVTMGGVPPSVMATPMVVATVTASSLDQAVKKIRKKTKGKIMSQKQVGSEFHIKVLLPNGKVKVYRVRKK